MARLMDWSLCALCLLMAVIEVTVKGFPNGGVYFAGAVAYFRLANREWFA